MKQMHVMLSWMLLLSLLLTGCGESDPMIGSSVGGEKTEPQDVGPYATWSLAYMMSLFDERNIPYTYLVNKYDEELVFDSTPAFSRFASSLSFDDDQVSMTFEGESYQYTIRFSNAVGYGEGLISDVNGSKRAAIQSPDTTAVDLTITEEWIKADILAGENGAMLLEIVHVLYGDSFEADLAETVEIIAEEMGKRETIPGSYSKIDGAFNQGEIGAQVFCAKLQGAQLSCYTVIPKVQYE